MLKFCQHPAVEHFKIRNAGHRHDLLRHEGDHRRRPSRLGPRNPARRQPIHFTRGKFDDFVATVAGPEGGLFVGGDERSASRGSA